jgi:octaprenyl-diphosphate synthase
MLRTEHQEFAKVLRAYEAELREVEEHLREMLQGPVALVSAVGQYILGSGGKRLRPLFLLASARLAGYQGREHIGLAAVVEFIHTASLLHDDVIDQAELRRGKAAAHSMWGNQVVILVGDYMYSNALKAAVGLGRLEVMQALSAATTAMTEGELLQLQLTGDTGITEQQYMQIIAAKTGVLISAACRIGAILAGLAPEQEEALAQYGLKAGLAFQMADDLLDYRAQSGFGKRLGMDLKEGKITLPLIYLLQAASAEEAQELKSIVAEPSQEALHRVMELLKKYGSLQRAQERARALVREAQEALASSFPPSEPRQELMSLAEYALMREH